MEISYDRVTGVTEEEFVSASVPVEILNDPERFHKADKEEKAKIERLLDCREGALGDQDMFLSRGRCDCGHEFSLYDFYFTALIDANHSKSLLLHTSIGSKLVIQSSRRLRCHSCARLSKLHHIYSMSGYICNYSAPI